MRSAHLLLLGLAPAGLIEGGCSHHRTTSGHPHSELRGLPIGQAIRLHPRGLVTIRGVPLAYGTIFLLCTRVVPPPLSGTDENFEPRCVRPSLRMRGEPARTFFKNLPLRVRVRGNGTSSDQWLWTRYAVQARGLLRGRDFQVRAITRS